MPSGIHVVERIEDDGELGEPLCGKLRIFDIGMVCYNLDCWVELLCDFFGDESFGLLDVFVAEQKLSVQVAEVDSIEVDEVYLAKTGLDQVLEQLTADTAGADQEDS